MEDQVKLELRKHFRPEFLNRVDQTIIFSALDEAELGQIVRLQLDRVGHRLTEQNLTLVIDEPARALLAREGYDPQYGARPLKRAIQDLLLNPLATKILAGEFVPGSKILVGVTGDALSFGKG